MHVRRYLNQIHTFNYHLSIRKSVVQSRAREIVGFAGSGPIF